MLAHFPKSTVTQQLKVCKQDFGTQQDAGTQHVSATLQLFGTLHFLATFFQWHFLRFQLLQNFFHFVPHSIGSATLCMPHSAALVTFFSPHLFLSVTCVVPHLSASVTKSVPHFSPFVTIFFPHFTGSAVKQRQLLQLLLLIKVRPAWMLSMAVSSTALHVSDVFDHDNVEPCVIVRKSTSTKNMGQ